MGFIIILFQKIQIEAKDSMMYMCVRVCTSQCVCACMHTCVVFFKKMK